MKTFKSVAVGIIFFITFGAQVAMSQEKQGTIKKEKVIDLNAEQVAQCVKLLPEFMKSFPAFNPMSNPQAKPAANPDIAALMAGAKIKKLDAFSQKNGYKDFKDFARSFTGVMSGYMYYKTQAAKKMFETQAKQLPPETAAILALQMKPINDNLQRLKATVSPELLKAVKPHVPALDKVMGLKE